MLFKESVDTENQHPNMVSLHEKDNNQKIKVKIRPVMEYANVVWGPNYIGDCQMLEKVQRRAMKCIPELFNLEYDDRLSGLNLPSLSY